MSNRSPIGALSIAFCLATLFLGTPAAPQSPRPSGVDSNTIRISGKKAIDYEASASVHRRERTSGSFDRTFSVPIQIDPVAIRAEHRDGVLTLTIPRAQSQKPRSIKIS